MRIYVSLAITMATAFILLPAMTLADEAPATAPPAATAGATPHGHRGGQPGMGMMGMHQNPRMAEKVMLGGFDILQSEVLKAETDRHDKAVEEILKPVKPIQEKLDADIKALHDKYFPPPPAEGEEAPARAECGAEIRGRTEKTR